MNFEEYKPKITEIANKYGLDLVVLFGSQATGRTHTKSDVDIAVLGKEKIDMPRLMVQMDDIFGRNDTQAISLDKASPTLMISVVRDGKLLYERKTGDFFLWKLHAIREWIETAWLRKLRDRRLVEWANQL